MLKKTIEEARKIRAIERTLYALDFKGNNGGQARDFRTS